MQRGERNYRADVRMILGLFPRYGVVPPLLEPEHRLIPRLLLPGQTAFDIGANVGAYALQISKVVGTNGRVFAFEPYPLSANRLRSIVRFLRVPNVSVIESAITNETSTVLLSTPKKGVGGSYDALIHVENSSEGDGTRVRTTTIDSEMKRIGLASLDFIKCDVEGSEWMVFDGGRQTISAYQPAILCEVDEKWAKRYHHTPDEVFRLVKDLGDYTILVYEHGKLIPPSSASRVHSNYVFLPSIRGLHLSDLLD